VVSPKLALRTANGARALKERLGRHRHAALKRLAVVVVAQTLIWTVRVLTGHVTQGDAVVRKPGGARTVVRTTSGVIVEPAHGLT
jgi:hypothetical protein